MRMADATQQ